MSKDYNLETLTLVKLTEVWQNEAGDFTPWLADNLDLLADSLRLNPLELIGTEQDVDGFRADIVARESQTNKKVVIENQLYDTDHDHLGKAITYAAWKDANIVVWVTRKARPAHRLAVKWLNEHTDDELSFYLLEIELWKIGNTRPAPRLNVIERPNEIEKAPCPSVPNKQISVTGNLLMMFWWEFLAYVSDNTAFNKAFRTHKVYPGDSWYSLSVGNSAYHIDLVARVRKKTVETGLYFNNCIEEYERFLALKDKFGELFNGCEIMVSDTGLKDRRIYVQRNADISDADLRHSIFDWYIDMALRFKALIDKANRQ